MKRVFYNPVIVAVFFLIVVGLVAPFLISAKNTALVISGLALCLIEGAYLYFYVTFQIKKGRK